MLGKRAETWAREVYTIFLSELESFTFFTTVLAFGFSPRDSNEPDRRCQDGTNVLDLCA